MYTELLNQINKLLSKPVKEALQECCKLLEDKTEHYTWVGFYFMNHRTRQLHLGPYTGAPTDHTIIPFGKGICGQVAVSGTTYLAEDVSEESNYIACSMDVRSEIVLPVYHGAELVAQLDIDSNTLNAFSPEDEAFLQEICTRIGKTYGSQLRFENFFGHY
ncbi:MAG TPA: histidine kinase [Cryomorphaceae bacterium]|nr:histidine kinase [Owenweeksia sp.]MBG00590.1 histidine kinase [Owenweeksia sp.]HAD98081.1 histidine kinase [Cryomorphaceae bacterium]HBF21727.1 histidine kinase [Cryomorphaceae bacterium]|tara:strand:- start:869 stop:1351 length:483 start_codon:yes stop_codon:yes gene_type:complete